MKRYHIGLDLGDHQGDWYSEIKIDTKTNEVVETKMYRRNNEQD